MGKCVLITGAGSGIGRETALAFAARGADLELVDIAAAGLETSAQQCRARGVRVETHMADVADAQAMEALAARVHERMPALDVLVNNAGLGAAGRFLETSLGVWRRVMEVNLMGVVHGCRAFVPAMVARRHKAHVVNVASAAGFFGLSEMPVYTASKFAVVGLSESLRADLREHDIHVSCICPGIVDTPIVNNATYEGAALSSDAARSRIERLYRRRGYAPSKVADAIVRAVERDAGLVPVAPESWLIWWTQRAAPGLLARLGASGRKHLLALANKRRS